MEVQAKLYALEVLKEEHEKMQSLKGAWHTSGGHIWEVTVEGNKIKIPVKMSLSWTGLGGTSSANSDVFYNFELEKKGQELKGFVTISSYRVKNLCSIPGETNPASGTVSEDGRSMKLHWKWSKYTVSWANNQCTGVALLAKEDEELLLNRESGQATPKGNEQKQAPVSAKKKARK